MSIDSFWLAGTIQYYKGVIYRFFFFVVPRDVVLAARPRVDTDPLPLAPFGRPRPGLDDDGAKDSVNNNTGVEYLKTHLVIRLVLPHPLRRPLCLRLCL